MDDTLIDDISETLPALIRAWKASATACGSELASVNASVMRTTIGLFHRDRTTIGELASVLGVSMATASEDVEQLVALGWAERTTDPDDRRRALVSLTPKARRIGSAIQVMRRAQVRAALDRLTPDQRAAALPVLRALADALAEHPAAGP